MNSSVVEFKNLCFTEQFLTDRCDRCERISNGQPCLLLQKRLGGGAPPKFLLIELPKGAII
jgi:hypothetical protein